LESGTPIKAEKKERRGRNEKKKGKKGTGSGTQISFVPH